MIIVDGKDVKAMYFADKHNTPTMLYVERERQQINPDGYIQLQCLPSSNGKMEVIEINEQLQNIQLEESDIGIVSDNQYEVYDRENGILRFSETKVGKEILVSYMAVGRLMYSADRIFTNTDTEGNIIEVLGDIIRNCERIIADVGTLGDAKVIIEQTQANIDSLKNLNLDFKLTEGNSLKVKLDNVINSGKQINEKLTATNNTANDTKKKLDEWVLEHGDIIDLDNRVEQVNEQLDNKTQQLENSKASKQEVDIERKRIDSFTSLPQGSTTGDAELIDGRIGGDGVTYSNIGSAIRGQFNTIVDINSELLDIEIKGQKNIKGFVIGLVTGEGAISPSDNRISNANILSYITPKVGDTFSLSDYKTYSFALGKNDSDTGWIYNDSGSPYWNTDLVLKESDVSKVHHILIKRLDNNTVTNEDLNYINNNFFYNKNKITLKENIIGLENLKDDLVLKLNKEETNKSNVFHLSFDDVSLSLIDLYNNKDNYKSIFDNKFFNMLREFNERYGMVVSCYAYGDSVKFINNTFKNEFFENSNWLKFGFHCKSGGEDYSLISNKDAKIHYDTFIDNIYIMCGTPLSVDRMPRLNYFKGSLENLKIFRECKCGIIGCLSADDSRDTYYLNSEQKEYLRNNDVLNDYDNGLIFLSTDLRLDWFVDGFTTDNEYDAPSTDVYNELSNRFKNKKYADMYNTLVVFGHEWQVYNSNNTLNATFKNYIEDSLRFAKDYNFRFDFPMNYMSQLTPKKLSTSNAIYYSLNRELEFINGSIDGGGSFVDSNTRIIAKEVIFPNTKKATIKIPSDCKINYMYQNEEGKTIVGWSNISELSISVLKDTAYSFVVAKQDDAAIIPEDIVISCQVVSSI